MKESETPNLNEKTISDNTTHCFTTGSGMFGITTTITSHTVASAIVSIPLPLSSCNALTPPQVSPMENVDVLRMVVTFVGNKNYRFVATISQSFYAAYIQEFPKDRETKVNASSVKFARICWEEMSDLMYNNLTDLQRRLSCSAAIFGNLPAMQYLRSAGCEWDIWTCERAAKNGHLNILKYARENGCPWNECTCHSAAENGHLNILQYAHENGCPWNEDTCRSAAENGHLNILQYARENGCPWDEYTCRYAAKNGHLTILQYTRENGCPWNECT